jgi:hypothetical protein
MRLAPPLSTGEGPPPDDVEVLLRAYFRSEMPDPWPAPPLVRSIPALAPAGPIRSGSGRSRLALAASVALLVAGTLAVPHATQPAAEPIELRMLPGEATRVRLTETLVQPKDKPTEWHIEVTEDGPPRK